MMAPNKNEHINSLTIDHSRHRPIIEQTIEIIVFYNSQAIIKIRQIIRQILKSIFIIRMYLFSFKII